MQPTILQQNIVRILGIDQLPLEEQAAFLAEIGDVVFQSSLLRLVSTLSDEQQTALEQYLDTEPEPDVLLQYLLETYSDFENILETVVTEFKEDAVAVLEKQSKEDISIIDATATE